MHTAVIVFVICSKKRRKLDDVHVIVIGAQGPVAIGDTIYGADNVFILIKRSVFCGTAPYTYQWQYAGYDSDSYKNYKTTDAPTVKFTPTENLGKECKIRCVITDANGKTVTSEVFKVNVVIDLS